MPVSESSQESNLFFVKQVQRCRALCDRVSGVASNIVHSSIYMSIDCANTSRDIEICVVIWIQFSNLVVHFFGRSKKLNIWTANMDRSSRFEYTSSS